MQDCNARNRKLPFECRMLCLSLAGATALLAAIFALYQAGLMSMVVAVWAAVAVFVIAAIYEIFLLSLVLRHMLMGDP